MSAGKPEKGSPLALWKERLTELFHRYQYALLVVAAGVVLMVLPALGGFLGYCLLLSNKCLLCGLIALVAMLFCVPGQKRLRSELHIDKEVEE